MSYCFAWPRLVPMLHVRTLSLVATAGVAWAGCMEPNVIVGVAAEAEALAAGAEVLRPALGQVGLVAVAGDQPLGCVVIWALQSLWRGIYC